MKALKHFITITNHKILVMKGCFKLGLYKQGLLHDMSKYSATEFLVGCRYFQGERSPNNAEREIKGYSDAWLHHKGRNKHHFEFWVDYSLDGKGMVPVEMPVKYVAEMFVDRVSASKIYLNNKYNEKEPLKYFNKGKVHYGMHDNTSKLLEKFLEKLAADGEDATLKYIKKEFLKK